MIQLIAKKLSLEFNGGNKICPGINLEEMTKASEFFSDAFVRDFECSFLFIFTMLRSYVTKSHARSKRCSWSRIRMAHDR